MCPLKIWFHQTNDELKHAIVWSENNALEKEFVWKEIADKDPCRVPPLLLQVISQTTGNDVTTRSHEDSSRRGSLSTLIWTEHRIVHTHNPAANPGCAVAKLPA